FLQGLFSLGDRRVGNILTAGHQNRGNWARTIKESPVNPSFYVHREKGLNEILPWDLIDHGVQKSFLASEYRRALSGIPSPPCPVKSCRMCGAC
ncbi:MAG: radical SAM protein, partial [Thermodesulfobacteriota bacterium]